LQQSAARERLSDHPDGPDSLESTHTDPTAASARLL
jgi:hypothetical protein